MSVPRSKISWTDYSGGDANFVIRGRAPGDCEISAGCANCYAAAILRRSGQTPERTTFYPEKLRRLSRARFSEEAGPFRRGSGSRPLVFVVDMGDLFHDAIPTETIVMILQVLADRPDVDWQILTKRAERLAYVAERYGWPANASAGVTVENQQAANERIPHLLRVPAPVRFLSCEPLIGSVDLTIPPLAVGYGTPLQPISIFLESVDWVIAGGESGFNRRPFDPAWARRLRDQCQAARVPFFFKQGSGRFPGQDNLLDGRTWEEFPA